MPRHYKSKLSARKYSVVDDETLNLATAEINQGKSQRSVAKKYGLTRSTLQNKIAGKHAMKPGHPTVLLDVEEASVVKHLLKLSDWGFPIDKTDLRMLVKSYIDKSGRVVPQFKNNYPGDEWAASFLVRHKAELSQRFSQNITPTRAQVDPKQVKRYFENLKETLKDVPPANIVNYDETNLTDDPGKRKCIFRRGIKYPERSMHHSKSSISLMFAGSASGELLPVYVVYRAEHLWDTWTKGGPPGTRYNRSKSGWFDNVCFKDWLTTIGLPYLRRKDGPKVLIGDNLSSHFSDEVLETCRQHDIKFVCLPPNSTHMCQPLDVAFFKPLKTKWQQILSNWKTGGGRRSATVSKDKFPYLLNQLLLGIEENQCQNLKSGFRKTGIMPINANEVLSRLPCESNDPDSQPASPEAAISTVFIDHLRAMRYGGGEPEKKVRKKKLPISPGKSISNILPQGIPGPSRPDTSTEVEDGSNTDDDSSSASSSDTETELSDQEQLSSDTDIQPLATLPVTNADDDSDQVEVGNYVIVTYKLKKSTKNYIGKVEQINDETYHMTFMRRYQESDRKFVFPELPDKDIITKSQINKKLERPTIRRGIYEFVMNFTGINVQ